MGDQLPRGSSGDPGVAKVELASHWFFFRAPAERVRTQAGPGRNPGSGLGLSAGSRACGLSAQSLGHWRPSYAQAKETKNKRSNRYNTTTREMERVSGGLLIGTSPVDEKATAPPGGGFPPGASVRLVSQDRLKYTPPVAGAAVGDWLMSRTPPELAMRGMGPKLSPALRATSCSSARRSLGSSASCRRSPCISAAPSDSVARQHQDLTLVQAWFLVGPACRRELEELTSRLALVVLVALGLAVSPTCPSLPPLAGESAAWQGNRQLFVLAFPEFCQDPAARLPNPSGLSGRRGQ